MPFFGKANFRNEVIWGYRTGGVSKTYWPRKHDIILLYAKSNDYTFNPLQERILYDKPFFHTKVDESGQLYEDVYVRDVWDDEIKPVINVSRERVGYPTQKPLDLLRRIIGASSNEGDMVLDPFCGCATTCVAAEDLLRQWVGIDVAAEAKNQVINRLTDDLGLRSVNVTPRTDQPARTDLGALPPYRTHKNELYGRQDGNCAACGEHQPTKANLAIDHIVPKSKGGTDDIGNLQLLCTRCNSVKGDRPMEYLVAQLLRMGVIDESDAEQMRNAS